VVIVPFKDFSVGEILTSSDVDTYLMSQAVIRCTSGTRPASPAEGWHIYETDTKRDLVYKGGSWQPLNMWEPIERRVIASGAPVVTTSFQNINTNYHMLRISASLNWASGADILSLRFNNDSGSNYRNQSLSAGGSSVGASTLADQTRLLLSGTGTLDNEPFVLSLQVGKFAANRSAGVHGQFARENTPRYFGYAGSWLNTSSLINRVDLASSGVGTFYGIIALEGVWGGA
jgi:hypothetical protein